MIDKTREGGGTISSRVTFAVLFFGLPSASFFQQPSEFPLKS